MHEDELIQNMVDFVDNTDERIRRLNRRIRNEQDEATGEVFAFMNRRLVSHDQIKQLRKSLWALVVSVNAVFQDVVYWDEFHRELEGRVRFSDDDEDAER
jgi:hypothetical protein